MNAPFPNVNVDMNDLSMLHYYAEQASLYARNNPQNFQAQQQALWWAERRAALMMQQQQAQMNMQLHGPMGPQPSFGAPSAQAQAGNGLIPAPSQAPSAGPAWPASGAVGPQTTAATH